MDNIAKPIVDAMVGVIYVDDRTIVKCILEKVNTAQPTFELQQSETQAIEDNDFTRLLQLIGDEQSATYIEVGQISDRVIDLGVVQGEQDAIT